MKKIIKKHSLILLNLYGVKEKLILENPEALNSFVELLDEEFNQDKQKLIGKILKKINTNYKGRDITICELGDWLENSPKKI